VVGISKFTAVKIFDKRSSPSGWSGTDGLVCGPAYTLACADLTRDFSSGSISRPGPSPGEYIRLRTFLLVFPVQELPSGSVPVQALLLAFPAQDLERVT
jgi:hypothetical protein